MSEGARHELGVGGGKGGARGREGERDGGGVSRVEFHPTLPVLGSKDGTGGEVGEGKGAGSIFKFDAVCFIGFSAKLLIDGFNGFGTVILSLISENSRSRFMLELMLLLCQF